MPQTSSATTETIYFVAHNGGDIVHYGSLGPGSAVGTGQPNLEEFDTAILMARRAFGLNPDVFELRDDFELRDEEREYQVGDFVRIGSDLYVKGAESFELVEEAAAAY